MGLGSRAKSLVSSQTGPLPSFCRVSKAGDKTNDKRTYTHAQEGGSTLCRSVFKRPCACFTLRVTHRRVGRARSCRVAAHPGATAIPCPNSFSLSRLLHLFYSFHHPHSEAVLFPPPHPLLLHIQSICPTKYISSSRIRKDKK